MSSETNINSVEKNTTEFLHVLLLEGLCTRPVERFCKCLRVDCLFVDLDLEASEKRLELVGDVVDQFLLT